MAAFNDFLTGCGLHLNRRACGMHLGGLGILLATGERAQINTFASWRRAPSRATSVSFTFGMD